MAGHNVKIYLKFSEIPTVIAAFGSSIKKCIKINANQPSIGPEVLEVCLQFLENMKFQLLHDSQHM